MRPSFPRNPALIGFTSLRSDKLYDPGDFFEGCPDARAAGAPTSVAGAYASAPRSLPDGLSRMPAFGEWLPFLSWPSLGEGGTPLIEVAAPQPLGALLIKAEWMNPTGSHKDRMTPLGVARAVEAGASGVICASSGNAGISAAAYAAHVGLPATVVVTGSVPDHTRRALLAYGARVVGARDSLTRWRLMKEMVERDGWYPLTNYSLPAVGSNPWGVEGYKTVAFELAAMGRPLAAILVPTARGDLLWGIGAGFRALQAAGLWSHPLPRLVAAEPFPRLGLVLSGKARTQDDFPGTTKQISTGGSTVTDQAVRALQDTGGEAIAVDDTDAGKAQAELARAGIYLELCAAAAYAAAGKMAAGGAFAAGDRVVLIGTSSGFRDPLAPLPPLEYAA